MCQISLFYRAPNCSKGPSKEKDCKRWYLTNKRGGSNKSEIELANNQMMSRLPGFLFKFIQKHPPVLCSFYCCTYVRKQKWKELFLEISHKIDKENNCVLESIFKNLLKKRLSELFFCEFCEFLYHRTTFAILATASKCCFFLLIFFSPSLATYSQLGIARQLPYTHCVCFTPQLFFMIAAAIFPVFHFLFLKLNMFPALHLCSVLPFLLGSFCRPSVFRLRC